MTPIRFKRESDYAVSVFDDTDDGANRGGFSGPKEVIQGIMDMQEEARQFRAAGILKAAGVRGTGTDRGAAEAVMKSVADAECGGAAAPSVAQEYVLLPAEYVRELNHVFGAARRVVDKLSPICGFPELSSLDSAIKRAEEGFEKRCASSVENQKLRRAVAYLANAMLDKLMVKASKGWSGWNDAKAFDNDRLVSCLNRAVRRGDPVDVANYAMMCYVRGVRTEASGIVNEEAPEPAVASVSIEDLPYADLVVLLQTDQISVARFSEELERRRISFMEDRRAKAEQEAKKDWLRLFHA